MNLKRKLKRPLIIVSDAAVHFALNQADQLVYFFSRTLSHIERKNSAAEKEACAIIEAEWKLSHLLTGRHFTILTDQQVVNCMFNTKGLGKIKKTTNSAVANGIGVLRLWHCIPIWQKQLSCWCTRSCLLWSCYWR